MYLEVSLYTYKLVRVLASDSVYIRVNLCTCKPVCVRTSQSVFYKSVYLLENQSVFFHVGLFYFNIILSYSLYYIC